MEEVHLLVRAGQLIPGHDRPAIIDGAVSIRGNVIDTVGTYDALSKRYPGIKVMGGKPFLLIPGLINGHGHGKGLTDFQRGSLDNTLESWLLDRKYTPESVFEDTSLCVAHLLRSGVTTTMHNHVLKNPAAFEQEFDDAIRAHREAGIRVQFNPGVRNRNLYVYGDNDAFLQGLPGELRKALTAPPPPGALNGDNFVESVRELHTRYDSPMCRIGFGPNAPQWCTDDLLRSVKEAADQWGVPVHVHALQSIFQKIYGLEFLGKTLIEHMEDIGCLGPNVVIGHCVWPTERDIEILARTRTGVTHHPSCNLRVRNGISPVFHMVQAGVRVGLGIDSKTINDDEDFIQEMKVCYLLHRIPSLELDSPHLSARQVFRMATETNAGLLGYDRELGRLEPGRLADLVLLDYEKMCHPYADPSLDPREVLLYRGKKEHVRTVIVDGRIVVEEGRLLTIDEHTIGNRLAEAASRPRTEKEQTAVRVGDELRRHVIRYYQGWTQKVKGEPYFTVNSRTDGLKRRG